MSGNSRRIGRWIEAGRFSFGNRNILIGPDVKADRPVDHRRIPDVDVLVHRYAYFGVTSDVARAGVKRAPDFCGIRLLHLDDAIGLAAAADLIVDGHIQNRRITAVEAKILVEDLLRSRVLDLAALAGR